VLGQLRYRTSYGQNVLGHLKECAHLAALMAAEVGLDATVCSRAALLHDIGKALTHQSTDSHALVGAELARRHGESDDVVHAIEAHHNEVEPRTVEAVLVQAADAISGARPGARREAFETYVKRLTRLEEIANGFPGVEKSNVIQAGREVRVVVTPERIDDGAAAQLSETIARRIENELQYPGQIKVVVIRETRAVDYAR
jgi:ribonucrease Y